MPGVFGSFKDILLFREPKKAEHFILKETVNESENKDPGIKTRTRGNGEDGEGGGNREERPGRGHEKPDTSEKPEKSEKPDKSDKPDKPDKSDKPERRVSKRLSENLEYVKKRFSIPLNSDVMLREFDIVVKDKVIPAFLIFYDGMVDRKVINDDILQPLMLLSNLDIKSDERSVADYIVSHLLPHNQLKQETDLEKAIDEVNFGGCAIFVDGIEIVYAADVKGWEHRNVERPNTELVIRGPQEGFTELLRANSALIRKALKDEDLIVEGIEVGRRSKTPCSLMYIKDIANDSLVGEVRRRLSNISVDYVLDSGELEQFIEDSSILPSPQILSTERPDRVCSMLIEGRVAVIMNGSPFALVVPITNNDLIHSPEDSYLRFPYSNLLRVIRIFAVFMSLLLPGIYLAITNFHQEMIPTDLLFAIEASREKVPFPSVVEILIMEISFELIREAGIRIPGPIGPTLGIIGALILGQAAVAANIVSPILIIIVAVTGISSFAIPNFSLGFAFRITRFVYIFLGALVGFLGIATGIFIQGIWLVNAKSFGVPFIAPNAPKTSGSFIDDFLKAPVWKQEKRPDFVNPKDIRRQPKISRKWMKPEEGK